MILKRGNTILLTRSRFISPFCLSSLTARSSRFLSTPPTASADAYLRPPDPSHPGITRLALNKPNTKNAISMRLLKDFRQCLDEVQSNEATRVLLIHSTSPDAFCSGADLSERRSMSQAQIHKFLLDLRSALTALENLPYPTIAAIDGPALGGGLELALACDLRVAGASVSKIGLPETKLGIIPGAGGTQRLTRLLGVSRAKDLIFTGRVLPAEQAFAMGLVDYISEPDSSGLDRALQLARDIAVNAPLALRAAKKAISRAPELSMEPGLDFERASYEPLLHTKDRLEALEAFKAKRMPIFTGE